MTSEGWDKLILKDKDCLIAQLMQCDKRITDLESDLRALRTRTDRRLLIVESWLKALRFERKRGSEPPPDRDHMIQP